MRARISSTSSRKVAIRTRPAAGCADPLPADDAEVTLTRELGHLPEPAELRDLSTGFEFALEINETTKYKNHEGRDTLALAYHRTDETAMAIETQRKALSLLPEEHENRPKYEQRLAEYEAALESEE